MSLEGRAIPEYASLSGKIHALVIDKTLSIPGAAADAKAVSDAIDKAIDEEVVDKALETLGEVAAETARKAAEEVVDEVVAQAIKDVAAIQADEIRAICV